VAVAAARAEALARFRVVAVEVGVAKLPRGLLELQDKAMQVVMVMRMVPRQSGVAEAVLVVLELPGLPVLAVLVYYLLLQDLMYIMQVVGVVAHKVLDLQEAAKAAVVQVQVRLHLALKEPPAL
jgi:hypothetical protein